MHCIVHLCLKMISVKGSPLIVQSVAPLIVQSGSSFNSSFRGTFYRSVSSSFNSSVRGSPIIVQSAAPLIVQLGSSFNGSFRGTFIIIKTSSFAHFYNKNGTNINL